MTRLIKRLVPFLVDEDGPTAIEYALMLMLVFLVCLSGIQLFGQANATRFEEISVSIQDVCGSGSGAAEESDSSGDEGSGSDESEGND